MSQSARPDVRSSAGFTLIEALAALSLVAVGLTSIGALANTSFRAGMSAERRLALVETARAALSGLPARASLAEGRFEGQLNGHAWRVSVEPLAGNSPKPPAATVWKPERVALVVRAPSGEWMEVDTVRLTRAPR